MTEPTEARYHVNGVDLCVFEWPGEGRPIVFAHATGFHARCWDEVIRHLPGRRCIAIDMRGHGRSEKPARPYEWPNFGHDVAALADALQLEGALAVGHSMGGHSVTLAAALRPGAFAGLLLVDPVVLAPDAYGQPRPEGEHFVARRRNEWSSAAEMFERFRSRPPYSLWQEQVLRDYCDYGLLPAPGGNGFVLACPPKVEAEIYSMSAGGDIYTEIEALDLPVAIIRAKPRGEDNPGDFSASPTFPALAEHFPDAVDLPHPELTHFIPMQDPALVAAELADLEARVNARFPG